MFQRKRVLKKHKQKQQIKLWLFAGIALIVILGVVVFSWWIMYTHRDLYVSPLSSLEAFNIPTESERNVALVEKLLRKEKIAYDSVSVSGSSMIVILERETEVILSQKKDIAEQISSLQYILSRLTMEGKLFSRLDLRFEKPVVVLPK